MPEKSQNKSTTSTNKYKFIRLTRDNIIWIDPTSGFGLNRLADKAYINVSRVPKKAQTAIDKAVDKGLLEYCKDPDTFDESKSTKRTPLVTNDSTNFKWTDEKKDGEYKKSPSFTNRNLLVDTDDPVVKQAFKHLAQAPNAVIKQISTTLAGLESKDKIAFTKKCITVEKSGTNPAMRSRSQVIDYLKGVLVGLGASTGVSNVVEEMEPLVQDAKAIKINL